MASIQKRGNRWVVRWRDPDGTERTRSCKTAEIARQLRVDVERSEQLGAVWRPEAPVRVPPLSQLFDAWLTDLGRMGRASGTIVRAYAGAKKALTHFRDTAPASVLSRAALAGYDAWMARQGLAVATRRAHMWAVMAAWSWGWTHDEWRRHLGEPAAPSMPAVEQRLVVAPTWQHLDRVVGVARATLDRYPQARWAYRLVVLLRGLGWRAQQALELDWADVDLERGMITCRTGKSRQEKRGRVVPMAPWLTRELATWDGQTGVVVGHRVSVPWAGTTVRLYWQRTGAPAELYDRRPDHAFRIGLISGLTSARVPHEAVEYYVGHALPGTRRAYVAPASLPLAEVAASIPPISAAVVTAWARNAARISMTAETNAMAGQPE